MEDASTYSSQDIDLFGENPGSPATLAREGSHHVQAKAPLICPSLPKPLPRLFFFLYH